MAKRVLVVDDEASTCRLIEKALLREGLEVACCSNGAECLLAIQEKCPDLVILDVMMPILDGFKTLSALRDNDCTKDLPVLMLTARREDKDVLQGWMSGVDLYLTKPFDVDELRLAVRRILEGTEAPAEAEPVEET